MVHDLCQRYVCFDMIKAIKDSHLVNSKVAFLKSIKNAAGIGPFFYGTVQGFRNIYLLTMLGSKKFLSKSC